MAPEQPIDQAVARVARDSCRRLVAFLASRGGSVAEAEDALAEAFKAALETWPSTGVPHQPEAWLLTVARRRLVDAHRHAAVHADAAAAMLAIADEAMECAQEGARFPDERLKLMFVCAHPAIDPAARTPLMLQVVLGVDAADIASAFLVKPATMGQRLSRAKAKIRDAGISYEVPRESALPERLEAVLQALYGIYGMGWDDVRGADPVHRGYAQEALELAQLLQAQLPREPEAMGLLALMLHCEARRPARRNAAGEFVPLDEQDTRLWQAPLIDAADHWLAQAAAMNTLGRFQLEAAIQSVHARRAVTGTTDWPAIALLYDGLARMTPTLGILVARASAWAQAHGPAAAQPLLEALPRSALDHYQPYWALQAKLLLEQNLLADAARAFDRAIGLCVDPAARAYLLKQESAVRARLADAHSDGVV